MEVLTRVTSAFHHHRVEQDGEGLQRGWGREVGSWKMGRSETSERSQGIFFCRGPEKNCYISKETEMGGGL